MRRTEIFIVVAILAIAAGFRLYGLDTTPPGLYPDEANVGNEAAQAGRTGNFAVFYPYNNGEEGLYANMVAISVSHFGHTAYAIRVVSALMGILTVLGTYLLARQLFDSWQLAAIAAFFMATGFWHVNFSRIGFRAILGPLMAVWSMYYLTRGIRSHRLWHWALAGLFLGLGMHTYIAFRIFPVATVLVVLSYWLAVRKSFAHDKYAYTRGQFWGNFALLVAISLLVTAPLAVYFANNPGTFTGRAAQVSVFSGDSVLVNITINTLKEIGMFFFAGDNNWRHNLGGQPILFFPVGALFAVGLLHTIWRYFHNWKHRNHPGIPQTLLLGWFVVGLVPAIVSNEGVPHALRSLLVAPVVYIMAAVGLWWLYGWLHKAYARADGHHVIAIALVALLLAIGVGDARRYFVEWGQSSVTAAYFNTDSVAIANQINALPAGTAVYVVVDAGGIFVNGLPMPAATVTYLTDTWTPEQQLARHITYLLPDQFARMPKAPAGVPVFHITQ